MAVAACAALVVVFLRRSIATSHHIVEVDRAITDWFVAVRTTAGASAFRYVTFFGSGPAVALGAIVAALAIRRRGHRWLAALPAAAALAAGIVVRILKVSVARPRPPAVDQAASAIGWAFPSGHSAQAAAFYGALAAVVWALTDDRRSRRSALVLAVLAAVAIGASRVYHGVHGSRVGVAPADRRATPTTHPAG